MTDVSLFPELPAPEPDAGPFTEPLSAGRRLTARQRADVNAGRHPLMRGLKLHRNGETCGTCAHRHHNDRGYPKCELRPTRGQATDCRAWWPACTAWQPKGDE